MRRSLRSVETALVSTATRNVKQHGVYVKKGDFIGVQDKAIRTANATMADTLRAMADFLLQRSTENRIFQVITGREHEKRDLEALVRHLEKQRRKLKVEVIAGNQPVYPFILGL